VPNSEIAIRLNDPKKYSYFRRTEVPKEDHWSERFGVGNVDYIYGSNKETGNLEIQSVRIKVKNPKEYTQEEIENYIKERKLSPIKIEMPKDYQKKGLFDIHDFEKTTEPLHRPGVEFYTDFESSNIESIEMDYLQNVMKVVFLRSQTQYLYSSIPAAIAHSFKHSMSKGQYFALKIKNCYPTKRLNFEVEEIAD
jgi:hypothetical protein